MCPPQLHSLVLNLRIEPWGNFKLLDFSKLSPPRLLSITRWVRFSHSVLLSCRCKQQATLSQQNRIRTLLHRSCKTNQYLTRILRTSSQRILVSLHRSCKFRLPKISPRSNKTSLQRHRTSLELPKISRLLKIS